MKLNPIVDEWADELSKRLNRSLDEIRSRGLSAYDFKGSDSLEIKYADGSAMHFNYAFALISQERRAVAIFTEHCGYMVVPLLSEMWITHIHEDAYRQE
jgi:hypothetical protein